MEPAAGAWCNGSAVCFRLRDHDRRLSGVRVFSSVFTDPPGFSYARHSRTWELRLPRPAVHRIE